MGACIGVCHIDQDQQVCEGCGRTLQEITEAGLALDDAPELTEEFFRTAEIKHGERIIRPAQG